MIVGWHTDVDTSEKRINQVIPFQLDLEVFVNSERVSFQTSSQCSEHGRLTSLSFSTLALHCSSHSCRVSPCTRRCLSLNDLRVSPSVDSSISRSRVSKKESVRSQSLFGTTTENEQAILKPLPYHPRPLSIGNCLPFFWIVQ